ncbi:hypothetical protein QVG61_09845 [Thiohalobacter sp. IOR34]|uniref:4Fe-4S dicluster domain-containing protein n=1 Tax=Thiohalobacter sp. IOR34 TaxID=3057176 RepID=UPI0025AFC8E8|nr:4Fe-4S dicluster domain-containing protein [Thiohalobacter sp. IOR34]WJW74801.1 hypothetical protein QVG61_09845 [Thiohalobacter sp. IOR34]
MDRRAFFQQALRKTGRQVVKQVDARVSQRASRWIRPPHALDELEFLLACTRCNACVEACPEQLIFPLPSRLGAQVVATPALDLLHKACALCEDWPCVAACEPGALRLPEVEEEAARPLPRLARLEIDPASCLPYSGPECGACSGSCPVPGALGWMGPRPQIDAGRCIGCAQCRSACILDPPAMRLVTRPAPAGTEAE